MRDGWTYVPIYLGPALVYALELWLSTRYYGAALLEAGLTQPEVETMTLKGAMTAEQWEAVC